MLLKNGQDKSRYHFNINSHTVKKSLGSIVNEDMAELYRSVLTDECDSKHSAIYDKALKLHNKIENVVKAIEQNKLLPKDAKDTDKSADNHVQSESIEEPTQLVESMSKTQSRVAKEYEKLYNTLSAMCDDEHIVHGRYTTSENFSPEAGPYQRYEFNGGLTVGKNKNKLIVSMGNPGIQGKKPCLIITSDSVMIRPYDGAEDRMCIYSSTNSERQSYTILPTKKISEGKKAGVYERENRGPLALYYIDQLLETNIYAADKNPEIADMYDDMSGLFRATMELTKLLDREYETPQEQEDGERRRKIYEQVTENSVLEEARSILQSNGINLD